MVGGLFQPKNRDGPAILLVCHANICRSPMAEGILRRLVRDSGLDGEFKVDSAGTHAGFIPSPPDARAQRVAAARGVDISKLKSRRVRSRDFERFTHILAMDEANLDHLHDICPDDHRHKLSLVLQYLSDSGTRDVPDPYYGNEAGFERVYQLLQASLVGFLSLLRANQAP